jgi:hypothetical protein
MPADLQQDLSHKKLHAVTPGVKLKNARAGFS